MTTPKTTRKRPKAKTKSHKQAATAPEITHITAESHPQTWALLQPPALTHTQQKRATAIAKLRGIVGQIESCLSGGE